VNALYDVERDLGNREGYGNLLEGASNDNVKISLAGTATANALVVRVNNTAIRTLTIGGGVDSCRAGPFVFGVTATANEVTIQGVSAYTATGTASIANGNTLTITLGGVGSGYVDGIQFRTSATAGLLAIDGANLLVGTPTSCVVEYSPRQHSAVVQSEVFVQNTEREYTIPIHGCMTRLEVLYPALLVGGGGIVLQLTLPTNDDQVFFSAHKTTKPVYEVSSVELFVPVLNYPDSLVGSLKQAIQQLGSINISTTDIQNFVYPYTASANMSIAVPVRVRSLKALYFFFQSNQTSADYTIPRTSARERIDITSWNLRVGSQLFPASAVQMSSTDAAQGVCELLKSVAKLGDLRLGSYLSKDNYNLSQANGGLFVLGIDLESLEENMNQESGLDTSSQALPVYLELTNAAPATAGVCYIYALYDSTLSVLANGNMIMSK
jgi:hypothetical protein